MAAPPTPVTGGPAAGSSPDPVSTEQAAVREEQLAKSATVLLSVSAKKLSSRDRKQLRNLRDAHLAHAAELRGIAAAGGASASASTSASPAGGRPGLAAAATQQASAERKAAASYRRQALAATGEAAQLWGSLATFSTVAAGQLKAARLGSGQSAPGALRVASPQPRRQWKQLSEVAAQQALVSQLHALVYGYQLATPQLAASRRDQGLSRLRQVRIFRDQIIADLVRQKAKVPAAAAAYVPSPRPVGPKTASAMLRGMESALAPYVGIWLAAAPTTNERGAALNQLGIAVANVQRWGGSLPTWPGN